MQTQLKIIIDSRNYLFALNIYWTHCCESLLLLSWQSARPFKHLLCDRSSINVWEGFLKKSSCSFGFCPNYLDPPPPNLDNLYHFFERQCAKKFGQGSPPPSPSPNWPNIYSLWKVDKNFGQGPPPLIWTNWIEQLFFSGDPPLLPDPNKCSLCTK